MAWWYTWTWLWSGEEEVVVVSVLRRVALVVAEWVSVAEELVSGVVAWAWEVDEWAWGAVASCFGLEVCLVRCSEQAGCCWDANYPKHEHHAS